MIREFWTFDLEDGRHTVELFWSLWSPRERLCVDGGLIADQRRWTFTSRYSFCIDKHRCDAVLRLGGGKLACATLDVDGCSVEMLPCRCLLRPAVSSPDDSGLLRASAKSQRGAPDRLLRAADETPPEPRAIRRS